MISENRKKTIKLSLFVTTILLIIITAIFIVIKYEVEGEKNMPFNVGKIIIISSAVTSSEEENINNDEQNSTESGIEKINNEEQNSTDNKTENSNNEEQNSIENETENTNNTDQNTTDNKIDNTNNAEQNSPENKTENTNNAAPNNNTKETESTNNTEQNNNETYIWNEKIIQTNDIYIYIDKNNNYKDDAIIKKISIENIQILNKAELGKIQIYMPNSLEGEFYNYIKDYIVGTSLTYNGAPVDNSKTLEIGNQGGCVAISFANIGLDRYKSNEDEQIERGATILEKMGITNEQLKFKVSFDLIIDVGKKSYKGNFILDLPIENLVGNKEVHTEITNFDEIVFKRKLN